MFFQKKEKNKGKDNFIALAKTFLRTTIAINPM